MIFLLFSLNAPLNALEILRGPSPAPRPHFSDIGK